MKVFAPNRQYTGISASVSFCNGVGETENPRLLHWFKSHGYEVEGLPESEEPMEFQEENPETPEENAEKEPDKEVKKGKSAAQKAGE